MLGNHTPRSSKFRQRVLLVVLLALVMVTLVLTVHLHSLTSQPQVAASWGNRVCDSNTLTCPPRMEIAASWGNALPPPPDK